MGRVGLLLLVLVPGLLSGCATQEPDRPTNWLSCLSPAGNLPLSNVVLMEYALLEAPLGDRYINHDLWELADEQVVSCDQRAALEDNGFRLGQIGGITPTQLQKLLTSEKNCTSPQRVQMQAGSSTPIRIGSGRAKCHYLVHLESGALPVAIEDSQCVFMVRPILSPQGNTRLQITPQVQHGKSALLPAPAEDRSGWMLREQRSTELYNGLQWEFNLALSEYIIIGADCSRSETLGYQCFARDDQEPPKQYLLVIRAGHVSPVLATDSISEEAKEVSTAASPPLALQAAMPAIP